MTISIKKPYITSPIFYANNSPHVGHLYTVTICDIWKKANALLDSEVFFSTGMDEHGQKVLQTANLKGYECIEYTDLISREFKDYFEFFNIEYSTWVRTTSPEHKIAVQHFWNILKKNGYIYKDKYEGWYNISDENYVENPTDAEKDEKKVVWRSEECYYFKLSSFESRLKNYYENNPEKIFPQTRFNETMGFINKGLKDFCISRPKNRLVWGIEVPDDETQVIYVWIDALVNYLSAIGYPDEKYKKYWPAIHVLGKDILKFHAIYWPALLMAANIELPERIIVHGWWLNGDYKISKSLYNYIDVFDLALHYTKDAVRYYFISQIKLGEDASFKEELFTKSSFMFLSNKYGNLFLRILGIAESNDLTKLPAQNINNDIVDYVQNLRKYLKNFANDITQIEEYLKSFEQALSYINNYINDKKIWLLDAENLASELYALMYFYKGITILYYPLIPDAAMTVAEYLKFSIDLSLVKRKSNFNWSKRLVLFEKK